MALLQVHSAGHQRHAVEIAHGFADIESSPIFSCVSAGLSLGNLLATHPAADIGFSI